MIRSTLILLLVTACATAGGGASPTTAGAGPELPDLASLTTEWGCGHGFWVSNPGQTVALHISYVGADRPEAEVELPHPDWEAALIGGTDLHANWCDDVIEQHEPVPVEHHRLEVMGGSLLLVGEVPEDFSGGELVLEASDLVVALPDGGEERLGDITITNPTWGFFAG